jgi:cobalt-zinc-cadmium efflux system membrane fusion protein
VVFVAATSLAKAHSSSKETAVKIKWVRPLSLVGLGIGVLVGVALITGLVPLSRNAAATVDHPPPRQLLGVELVKGQPHTLAVPEDVRQALGISPRKGDLIAAVRKPTRTRPLVMPGSTALDPARLFRIRARFAPSPSSAEVTEIAKVREDPAQSGKAVTVFREIRSGDHVSKGDVLAVFHSVDVGNKKNDLIDAIYQLKLDQEILDRAEKSASSGVLSDVFVLNARRAVQGDVNAVSRALSTLRAWGIAEEDIKAVRDEAELVKKREGKHDKSKDALWARVELRAPDDGVIIERNVSLREIVVDNTTNLFQIAKVNRLSVFANVPEDDLPDLEKLSTAQRRWTVRTVGAPPVQGFISDIGYLIDPNQHTAVVKGYIDNPGERLRAGQFVSATVDLPPPADVVEVPIDAVVDDGLQSVVFVQLDPGKHHYTMRRVQITSRFDRSAFVRSSPIPKGQQLTPEEAEQGLLPKEALRPGERVVQAGVGELKAALRNLESSPSKDRKEGKD